MVSRYHWVSVGGSGFLSSGSIQSLVFSTTSIPAGGILKKVLFRNCKILGLQTGTDEKGFNTWNMQQLVDITSGPNNGRGVYHAYKRIPMAPVAILSGLQNKWACYYNAGDLELGVDQKCSYGKSTDGSPWNVQVAVSLVGRNDGSNTTFTTGAGEWSVDARLLYYL